MQLSLDVIVSPDLDRLIAHGAAVVADELVRATEENLTTIELAVKSGTPVGVAGSLRGATQHELRGSSVDVFGRVFNPLGYAIAVEQGSRPHTPSLRAIEQWAKRKLGANATSSYRIWRSIQAKGTKPHAYFAPGLASVLERITDRYAVVPDRVVARLGGAA